MVAQGHIIDANTSFLWKFDELKTGTVPKLLDYGPHSYHATATTNPRSAYMRAYGPGGAACRSFANALTFATAPVQEHVNLANNATILTALKTQHTVEFFVRWQAGQASTVFTMGGANAINLRVDVLETTGYLNLFWEISGVDQQMTQTAGVGVVANVWSHVAIVKSTASVLFYVGGVLQQTVTRTASPGGIGEPNGATSELHLGCNRGTNLGFHGALKDLKITTRVKTGVEIAADAALLNTTFELPLTGDTLVLYRMNDTEEIVRDSGTVGLTLYHDARTAVEPRAVPGLIKDGGKGLLFWNDANIQSHTFGDTSWGTPTVAFRTMLLSAFTFECWIEMATPSLSAQHGLWCWNTPGNVPANLNFMTVDVTSDGRIMWWEEYGIDSDSTVTSTAIIPAGTHHLGLRRNATVAGFHTVDMFVDGVLVDTLTGLVAFDNGDITSAQFFLGYGSLKTVAPFYGALDDVRFSNIARTNAEILESYHRGIDYDAGFDVELTAAPGVHTPATSATFSFTTAEGTAEYSLDGAGYLPATSPLVFTGLDPGDHLLVVRSVEVPTAKQSFAWTVDEGEEAAPEPPIVPTTYHDAIYLGHVADAIARLPSQFKKDV